MQGLRRHGLDLPYHDAMLDGGCMNRHRQRRDEVRAGVPATVLLLVSQLSVLRLSVSGPGTDDASPSWRRSRVVNHNDIAP